MRKSSIFLSSVAIVILLFCAILIHAAWMQSKGLETMLSKRMMVEALKITDLCLFTDARYIRHLSQTDLHAPFQDHPGALEHFPSGSLIGAPQRLR